MNELEEKDVTLPAPTIRRMIRAARFERMRLEAADPYGSHGLMEDAIEEAENAVYGKDGEFASIPAVTAARLEANAEVIHLNSVKDLLQSKKHLFEELRRRGISDHKTYVDSTQNT